MRLCLLVAFICLLAGGCTNVPNPGHYDYSVQYKMQAAQHWDILAQDMANKINNELIRGDFLNVAVFVKETCGTEAVPCKDNETTQFNEGFRDLMVTQLVGYGIPTKTEIDRDVIVIDYKVQVILHSEGRVPVPRTGALTTLTAAISVLRNAPTELMAITLAGAYDYYNAEATFASNYEIIITTSMVSMKKYIFRSSDIYYVNDADFWHYKKFDGNSREIQLTNTNIPLPKSKNESGTVPPLETFGQPQSLKDI